MMAMAQKEMAGVAATGSPARSPVARTGEPGPQPFMEYALKRSPGAATGGAGAPAAAAPAKPSPGTAAALAAPAREELMMEIKSVRSLLEGQLASLAWSESARRAPMRTRFAGELLAAGFSPALTRAVTTRLPDDFNGQQADKWIASVLESNLRQAVADELVDRGGVYALVGPTGVGKTTSTAKLAARYVMKYGTQKLGLISADSYRIGAQDQLRTYGRILGVPVHAVQDATELQATLAALRDKHLVLIDTIGVGQRDPRVSEQIALLGTPRIRRLLLLNASCQGETLEDVVRAYRGPGLAGCLLTKLDEAVKPGAALDCAMRHRLALHYVSNGQRVPEDLHLPNIAYLVHRALKSATGEPFALVGDESGLLLAPMLDASRPRHAQRH
jgi:flagellar biosynthesis protein FlhF